MIPGVIIHQGPADWQILQRHEGMAQCALSGQWQNPEELQNPLVYVRVVREDDGTLAVPWTAARQQGRDWELTLSIPQGGLYRLETCLAHAGREIEWSIRGDMILHLGVGDVYVVAGQSNSAGYGRDMVYDPPEPGIHLLRNNGRWDMAAHPMNDSTGTQHLENLEGANPAHSPYLSFARTIRRAVGLPVGLIAVALGGSGLNQWLPGAALYENMLRIVQALPGGFAGMLWYQGCSDTSPNARDSYLERFSRMVSALREALRQPDLPVLTCQLNRHLLVQDDDRDIGWSTIREHQRQAARTIPGVFVVPTYDLPMADAIHNSAPSNMVLGERLSKLALSKIYHMGLPQDAPDLQSAQYREGRVVLSFAHVLGRLYAKDVLACDLCLTLEDDLGEIECSAYEIRGSTIELTPARTPQGKTYVHSGFGQDPKDTLLFDQATYLPVLGFFRQAVSAH